MSANLTSSRGTNEIGHAHTLWKLHKGCKLSPDEHKMPLNSVVLYDDVNT